MDDFERDAYLGKLKDHFTIITISHNLALADAALVVALVGLVGAGLLERLLQLLLRRLCLASEGHPGGQQE